MASPFVRVIHVIGASWTGSLLLSMISRSSRSKKRKYLSMPPVMSRLFWAICARQSTGAWLFLKPQTQQCMRQFRHVFNSYYTRGDLYGLSMHSYVRHRRVLLTWWCDVSWRPRCARRRPCDPCSRRPGSGCRALPAYTSERLPHLQVIKRTTCCAYDKKWWAAHWYVQLYNTMFTYTAQL